MVGMDCLQLSWATTGLIGLVTLILFYWYSTRNHGYWKKQGIPFIKPFPLIGTIWGIFKTPLHLLEEERYKKYGVIHGYFEGNRPMLMVGDPELLRDVFVKDFVTFPSRRVFETGNEIFDKMVSTMKGDEEWKRIRTIITPTFTTGKIKRMLSIFTDCSKTVVKNFKTLATEGKPVDCKRLFGGFSMDVIASSAFSTKLDSHNDPDNQFVAAARVFFTQQVNWRLYGAFSMDVIASSAFSTKLDSHNDPDNQFVSAARVVFTQQVNWRLILFLCFPSLLKIFKVDVFPAHVMEFFKNVTLQIIEERKKTGQVRNDFLQLLLDTAKEVEDAEEAEMPEKEDIASNYGQLEDVNPHILKTVTSKKLSMNELVAQCVIFFIAGYDTTASTLSFATYLLALNPDIQDRLRTEVDEALKKSNGEVTYEAVKDMKYLDNVISETLRMYPPLSRIDRQSEADYTLGNTGITITKGMIVSAPVYAMHRDPNLYPDPEKFDPDRFTPEERAKRDPYVYLPFGAGPRNCVAMRFALMEVKVCLAHVIANFNIKTCSETKVPLEFGIGQGLLQPKGIVLDMEVRKDSPMVA